MWGTCGNCSARDVQLGRGARSSLTVVESKCYSTDLPQGGWGILCILPFIGSAKDTAKVEELVSDALHPTVSPVPSPNT